MRINDKNKSVDMEARDINFILPPYVRSYLFYAKNEMPEKIVFPMFASVDIIGADRQPITIPIEWVSPESPVAKEIAKDGEAVAEVTPEQEAVLDEKDEEIKKMKEEFVPAPEGEKVVCSRCGGLVEEGVDSNICGTCADDLRDEETAETDQPTPAPEDIIRQQEETIQQLEDDTADKRLEVDTTPTAESPARAAFAEPPATPPTPGPERKPKQPPGGDIGPGQPLSDMHPRGSGDQVRTTRDLLEEPDITEAEEKPFEKEVSRDESGKPVVEDKPDAPD